MSDVKTKYAKGLEYVETQKKAQEAREKAKKSGQPAVSTGVSYKMGVTKEQLKKTKPEEKPILVKKQTLTPVAVKFNPATTSKAIEQTADFIANKKAAENQQDEIENYEDMLAKAQQNYDDYTASEEYLSKKRMRYAQQGQALMQNSGVSTYPASMSGGKIDVEDTKEAELRYIRDYYQNKVNAKKDKAVMDADLAELEKWSPEDLQLLDTYINYRQSGITSGGHAVPAQNAYKSLVEKYGEEKVANLAETRQRSQNEKAAQELHQKSAEAVEGKFGASIGHSAATIPANILGAVTGPFGVASDIATRTGRYATLDPNNAGNMPNVYSSAVRGQVAENISGDEYDEEGNKTSDGGAFRQGLALGYQGIMSAADSIARATAYGPASLGLAATSTFAQSVSDASRQGATPTQAVIYGIGTAAIEAGTEKIPLDEMLKAAKGGTKGALNIAKEALKQAGIEATTEEVSLFGSLLWEAAVLKEKSAYKQNIADAIAHGATYEDARDQANKSIWQEALQTAAVSAIAGGVSGAGSAAVGALRGGEVQTQAETQIVPEKAVSDATANVEAQQPITQQQMDENAVAAMGAELAAKAPVEAPTQLTEGQQNLKNAIEMATGTAAPAQKIAEQGAPEHAEVPQVQIEQEAAQKSEKESKKTQKALWGKRKNWQNVTDNSVWATALAMKEVNPAYFDAYMAAAEGEHSTPVIDAIINAANDVRQESISPMAAATVINEVYEQHGEAGLTQMYNPRNGNLYESVLNRMKAVDSTRGKVGIDLDEETRYHALKGKRVTVTQDTESAKAQEEIAEILSKPDKAKSKVEKAIKRLAVNLRITKKPLSHAAVDVEFTFSGGKGLKESMSKQLKYGGTYGEFAKAIANIDGILKNSVMIEQHSDKYKGTTRENRNLESTSVLMGIFKDGNNIIPVQFEIKKASEGGQLYVTVAMTKIEAGVLGGAVDNNQAPLLIPASNYSIADIVSKINPVDKHFLKYIPSSMLTEQQRITKMEALDEDYKRISSYERTDGKGPEAVREMLGKYGYGEGKTNDASIKGTGAAEQNFSGKAQYQDLLTDENSQQDRATDVRPMEVPKTDVNGNPVSEVAGNLYGSQFTPDEFASLLEEKTAEGGLSYAKITNDQATEYAKESITKSGSWENAYTEWAKQVDRGVAGAEVAARGALLLNHAAQQGDKKQWMNIVCDMQKLGTNTAQGLQAMRLVRELSPPDKLEFVKTAVRKMVADMRLHTDIEIDENLLDAYQNAETDEQRNEIIEQIQQNVADQIPSTFLDRINALRYTNMLGNLKTPGRNTISNVASMLMYRMKDQVAAGIDDVIAAVVPNYQKTKSHFVSKEYMDFGRRDFQNLKSAINNGGKFSGSNQSGEFMQGVMDKRRIHKAENKVVNALLSPLEGYRTATNWLMNNKYFGDEAFSREAYARALAGYLKANGVNASDIENADVKLMDKARAYAVQQAQEATFKDNSAMARIASRVQKATGIVGQGVMPFTKTPANVLTRAVEFSPLGIVDTAVKSAKMALSKTKAVKQDGVIGDIARSGADITGSDIVDSLAKTFTGTVMFALGAALFDQGWLVAGEDEDKDKAKYDDLVGKQEYALVLPDGTNYTLDWLSPTALIMFMGAEFWKVAREKENLTFADLEQVFTAISDPMIQMSMLQGVSDSLDSIKYSDNNLAQFLINAAVSYLTQGLTNTLLGQIERSTEKTRQTTYIDKESETPEWLQRQLGKASQKTPLWDYQQMEYRNAWGETEENEGGLLYNLLSPGYLSKEQQSAISDELYRLDAAQSEVNVFPQTPEKTINYTDKEGNVHKDRPLTQKELETIQTVQGQTAAKAINKLISSGDYQKLTDDQKAQAINAVYEFAKEKGKKAAIADYYSKAESWMKSANENDVSTFINRGALKVLNNAIENTVGSIANGWKVTEADKKEIESSYAAFSKMSPKAKQRIRDSAEGDVARYIEARENGVNTSNYLKAVEKVKTLGSNPKSSSLYSAIADSGITESAVDAIMKAYMTDYDPSAASPDKTELRYDYARQELGLTPDEYADAYKAFVENSKKDDRIAAWVKLGYTEAEAETLWNLFGSSGKEKIDVESWYNKHR